MKKLLLAATLTLGITAQIQGVLASTLAAGETGASEILNAPARLTEILQSPMEELDEPEEVAGGEQTFTITVPERPEETFSRKLAQWMKENLDTTQFSDDDELEEKEQDVPESGAGEPSFITINGVALPVDAWAPLETLQHGLEFMFMRRIFAQTPTEVISPKQRDFFLLGKEIFCAYFMSTMTFAQRRELRHLFETDGHRVVNEASFVQKINTLMDDFLSGKLAEHSKAEEALRTRSWGKTILTYGMNFTGYAKSVMPSCALWYLGLIGEAFRSHLIYDVGYPLAHMLEPYFGPITQELLQGAIQATPHVFSWAQQLVLIRDGFSFANKVMAGNPFHKDKGPIQLPLTTMATLTFQASVAAICLNNTALDVSQRIANSLLRKSIEYLLPQYGLQAGAITWLIY